MQLFGTKSVINMSLVRRIFLFSRTDGNVTYRWKCPVQMGMSRTCRKLKVGNYKKPRDLRTIFLKDEATKYEITCVSALEQPYGVFKYIRARSKCLQIFYRAGSQFL